MIGSYAYKKMTDVDWAIEVENLIIDGAETNEAMKKVFELREEYNKFISGLGPTKQEMDLTEADLIKLYKEEVQELYRAHLKKDIENFEEECWDVIQTILNLMDYKKINMKDTLLRHKLKLNSRGREFKNNIIEIL